ncbi:MAG: hypothetical protein JXP73_14680, partial [Deltaproteobacteria bacterium]|nr:hypothetical protein [Deltaproteobacteria bacterium]
MKPLGAALALVLVLGCGGSQGPPAGSGGIGGGVPGAGGAIEGSGGGPGTGGATRGTGGAQGTGGVSQGNGGGSGTGGATVGAGGATGSTATGALPEGDSGIAAKYRDDADIASNPAVIFADDFEGYAKASDLDERWDNKYQNQYIAITTATANVYAGKQALEFTLPQQDAELSDAVEKVVSPELDVLFLRYYGKFQP